MRGGGVGGGVGDLGRERDKGELEERKDASKRDEKRSFDVRTVKSEARIWD